MQENPDKSPAADGRIVTRQEAPALYAQFGVRRGRSYSTLCKLAMRGEGPEFFVIGGLAHYTLAAIAADAGALKQAARRG